MPSFYTAIVQALQAAHQQGWNDCAKRQPTDEALARGGFAFDPQAIVTAAAHRRERHAGGPKGPPRLLRSFPLGCAR